MNFKNVFVTVGTTKFDDLIATVIADDTIKVRVFNLPFFSWFRTKLSHTSVTSRH